MGNIKKPQCLAWLEKVRQAWLIPEEKGKSKTRKGSEVKAKGETKKRKGKNELAKKKSKAKKAGSRRSGRGKR